MTETPASLPPEQPGPRFGAMAAFGCTLVLLIVVVAFGLAVGGSFWSLALLGGSIALAGVVVVIFLARRNRRSQGRRSGQGRPLEP